MNYYIDEECSYSKECENDPSFNLQYHASVLKYKIYHLLDDKNKIMFHCIRKEDQKYLPIPMSVVKVRGGKEVVIITKKVISELCRVKTKDFYTFLIQRYVAPKSPPIPVDNIIGSHVSSHKKKDLITLKIFESIANVMKNVKKSVKLKVINTNKYLFYSKTKKVRISFGKEYPNYTCISVKSIIISDLIREVKKMIKPFIVTENDNVIEKLREENRKLREEIKKLKEVGEKPQKQTKLSDNIEQELFSMKRTSLLDICRSNRDWNGWSQLNKKKLVDYIMGKKWKP